jgi:hypothetical protein
MFRNKAVLFFIFIIVAGLAVYFIYKSYQKENTNEQQNKITEIKKEEVFLMTVFLKHDQGKTLDEIQKKLNETGFYKKFPPAGIEIESWKVVMGVGQVITLKVPPGRLREVNVALEKMAWGSFKTEFYPSYDFLPIYKTYRDTTSKDTTNAILE